MPSPLDFAGACMQRARSWRLPHPPAWLPRPGAPRWLRAAMQQRLTLFINHVLMQHPEAMVRMARHSGRQILCTWRGLHFAWAWTAAGLLEAAENHLPDLHLEVLEPSALQLARHALLDDAPHMHIHGDENMARDIRWLLECVRWDVQDDLTRAFGPTPARAAARVLGGLRQALRLFCGHAATQDDSDSAADWPRDSAATTTP